MEQNNNVQTGQTTDDNGKQGLQSVQTANTSLVFKTQSQIESESASFVIEQATDDEISNPEYCVQKFLSEVNSTILARNKAMLNAGMSAGQYPFVKEMPHHVIADFIIAKGKVALIAPGNTSEVDGEDDAESPDIDNLPLAFYQEDGLHRGLWLLCPDPYSINLGKEVVPYKPNATKRDLLEVYTALKCKAQVKQKCLEPTFVPVANGIFDMETKTLQDFDPDFVFTSKIRTEFNASATNPVFTLSDGSLWDVESWMQSLAPDDPELVDTLWEVVQAAFLPLAPRNQMVCLYAKSGNNGKGTLCALLRSIIGKNRTASISIADFSKDFGLTNLPNAVAIINDENDVNNYSEKNAVLKAVVTGDPININRKHKDPFEFSFKGLVLQCVNDFPKINDKS